MITHGAGHAAQQCRHLATCLGETEDVVHEQQDIFATAVLVAELLGHGEAREGHAQTGTRRLVHLAEHQRSLRLCHSVHVHVVEVPLAALHSLTELLAILDNATLNHLAQQVVTLARALAHTREHRESVVSMSNVVDKFHDEHSLAHTSATEQTNLTALAERLNQVNHLDTGVKNLLRNRQVGECRCRLMDGTSCALLERLQVVNGLTDDVEQTTFHLFAGGHRDGTAQVFHAGAAHQTVGAVHGHAAHRVLADVLLHLEDEGGAVGTHNAQGSVDGRTRNALALKGDIDNGADDLRYFSIIISHNHENVFVCFCICVNYSLFSFPLGTEVPALRHHDGHHH